MCVSPEESEVEEVEEVWEADSCMEKARHCFASRGVEVGADSFPSPQLFLLRTNNFAIIFKLTYF